MNLNQPYGRIVQETYKVKEVLEVKCWTIFRVVGSFSIQLKRFYTDRDLVSKVVGDEIAVRRVEHSPLSDSLILDVFYRGKLLYPVSPKSVPPKLETYTGKVSNLRD